MLYILYIFFLYLDRSSYTIRWSRKFWMCALACSISMAQLIQYRVQNIGVLPPSLRFIRKALLVGVYPIAYGLSYNGFCLWSARCFASLCCKTKGSKVRQIKMTSMLPQKDSSIWLESHAGLSWCFLHVKHLYFADFEVYFKGLEFVLFYFLYR